MTEAELIAAVLKGDAASFEHAIKLAPRNDVKTCTGAREQFQDRAI